MFIFYRILIIIFHQCIFIQNIQIIKIQNARITNVTSTLQANCATCICQCLTNIFSTSSSSSCCDVNCFIDDNTCQVIISYTENNPTVVKDHGSIVYRTNCFESSMMIFSSTTRIRQAVFNTTTTTTTIGKTFTNINPTTGSTYLPNEQTEQIKENYTIL